MPLLKACLKDLYGTVRKRYLCVRILSLSQGAVGLRGGGAETCEAGGELASSEEVSCNLPLSLGMLAGTDTLLLSCLFGITNSFQDLLGSSVVTGFYDLGMNFSFAA